MNSLGRFAQAFRLVVALFACSTSLCWAGDSPNDFGGLGLLQTPTARVSADAEFRVGLSSVDPYDQILAGVQLLPWLESQFRYLRVSNRLYGPREFSGGQSYKDRGIDLKVLLGRESDYLPAIAFGVMDVGGTGLFASEYVVASRRYYDLDFTLGLGWGRLGSRGGIRNPLRRLSGRFADRETVGPGGLGTDRFLRGKEVSIFGGVQWSTPLSGVSLKLEYDGNDHQSEALSNNQTVHFPLNAAVNWRVGNTFDISAGVERGDTAMLRLSVFTNFGRREHPDKRLDPSRTRRPLAATGEKSVAATSDASPRSLDQAVVEQVREELQRQEITLVAMDADEDRHLLKIWFSQNYARDLHRALGRVSQTLAYLSPANYDAFTLINLQGRQETFRVTVMRHEVLDAVTFRGSPEEVKASSRLDIPQHRGHQSAQYQFVENHPGVDWGTGPALRQHVGGPDSFYFAQLWWRTTADIRLASGWSINAAAGINVANNFDGLEARDTSALPPVRSDLVRYLKEGKNNLVKLETNYVWSPQPAWWARLSGGIFEEMYGGVAGELLYRPPYSAWAVGLNVNRVRQRDFDQMLDFRRYEVTTGHITTYVDLPFYDLHLELSAGQYLAGDRGGTFQLSRTFGSGAVVGAFATKTNVSAAQFGEGRFDKGFFLYLPMDLFFSRSTQRGSTIVFKPLTRDGGQKVRDGLSLYGLTQAGHWSPEASWIDLLN